MVARYPQGVAWAKRMWLLEMSFTQSQPRRLIYGEFQQLNEELVFVLCSRK
jgi:hypothetical protein